MENIIFIKDKKVCVKQLRSRMEAVQKLNPTTMPKGCQSFAGMVNFLSMFCPELQKLLKPIYDLTRKGRQFIWGKEQQEAFEVIKRRLVKAPVLHMPNCEVRFHLYSDMNKFATGSALYQIQNGKLKLIPYTSKRLPEVARSYSITELELCGLAINIASFSHLLKRLDFDTIVDHLALTKIIKSKAGPVIPRIKRLLELISSYSFNLYYMKGKDMILSDFYLDKHMTTVILMELFLYCLTCIMLYMRINIARSKRLIFSPDVITDKSSWNNITRGTLHEENIGHKHTTRKTISPDTQ